MERVESYYAVLGLNSSATPEELKRAWLDLVQVWHPDRFPGNSRLRAKADRKLREINEAYRVLAHLKPEETTSSSEHSAQPEQPQPHPASYTSEPFHQWTTAWRPSLARIARTRWTVLSCAIPTLWIVVMALAIFAGAGYLFRAISVPVTETEFVLGRAGRSAVPHVPPAWDMVPGKLSDVLWRAFGPQRQITLPTDAPLVVARPDHRETPRKSGRRGQIAREDVALGNGVDLILSRLRHGSGLLKLVNRTAHGAVAEIANESAPDAVLRIVSIGAGSEVLLNDIGSGSYVITFRSGKLWQPERRRFAEVAFSSGPFGPFRFLEIQSSDGIRSDHYEIVLRSELK